MKILRRLLTVLAALVLFGVVCAAGLIGFVYYKETHLPPVGDFDTIIVLGAQVKADGTPSVALERRLTAALETASMRLTVLRPTARMALPIPPMVGCS